VCIASVIDVVHSVRPTYADANTYANTDTSIYARYVFYDYTPMTYRAVRGM
jgi:hypothetical protein